jgi:hypothetical protein
LTEDKGAKPGIKIIIWTRDKVKVKLNFQEIVRLGFTFSCAEAGGGRNIELRI